MPRDLRDLGSTVNLRPARRTRWIVLLAGLLALGAGGVRLADAAGPASDGPVQEPPSPLTADPPSVPDEAPPPPRAPATTGPSVLGRAGDLLLHVPAADPLLVSYHEASFPEALPLLPLGTLSRNENPTRSLASRDHPDGLPFHVQVSRGRANAATSAVDVVLPRGEQVLAPVTGTVTEVRAYQLYGAHDDVRIELQPDDSEHAVVLLHVEDVVVRAGDRVTVGDVLAGGARIFPFSAVVDRQTAPDRHGHVHLEVKVAE